MELKTYLDATPRKERARLVRLIAERCEVTEGAVHHWIHGRRQITPSSAVEIVRLTAGAVSLPDLIPELDGVA